MFGLGVGLFRRGKKNDKGDGISIIIPFRPSAKAPERLRNVLWLKQYWEENLPGAEVIIGDDPDTDRAFSKSVAINAGVAQSTGDVLVLVDADGYIRVDYILHCAKEIRHARERGRRLWFVPYRLFYRLNEESSERLLASDPADPYIFAEPPDLTDTINDTNPRAGHWYGAMIQIVPREGWDIVGGWDERFRGWGGEDHAAMRAMDTLYWPHKTLPTSVLHVWHPMIGGDGVKRQVSWKDRRWEGQDDPTINNRLSWRYYYSMNKPELMRKLVDEWKRSKHHCHPHCPEHHHKHKHHHHHHHHQPSI
jgi:glycosyltransferase involved in cell wall biosynthesis